MKILHIEASTACNARCPMCPRNDRGAAAVIGLPLHHLRMERFRKALRPALLQNLEVAYFCGAYGEPTLNPNLGQMIEWIHYNRPRIEVGLHTNGETMTPEWWSRLARLSYGRFHAVFALDGLEDTHAFYRTTDFNTVVRHMRAFIDAGGCAEWHYLVFKHNQHQVGEARKRAEEYGCKKFVVKKTSRFLQPDGSFDTKFRAFDSRVLEMPTNPAYINNTMVFQSEQDQKAYWDTTPITCKAMQEDSAYLDASCYLFPCCWTAMIHTDSGTEAVRELIDQYGEHTLDASLHTVEEIQQGPIHKAIIASWKKTIADGRVRACAMSCGACDKYREQMGA